MNINPEKLLLMITKEDLKATLREILNEINLEPKGKDILTVSEAAEYLGVSDPTVRALIRANKIPCLKLGQVTRLSRRALLECCEKTDNS